MKLGLDIGGTKTAAAILRADGSVAALHTAPSGHGPAEVIAVAAMLAKAALAQVSAELALTPDDSHTLPQRAGACMPGLVDPLTGRVRHAVNLGVSSMDLRAGLSEALGLEVSIENDVKAAALGADQLMRARAAAARLAAVRSGSTAGGSLATARITAHKPEHQILAYLNVGTGLAAAVVRDGQVVRGRDGIVGEIGHLPVAGGAPCKCGQFGCLETIASGSALDRLWNVPAGRGRDPFAAAAAGDQRAAHAARVLCHGIALSLQLLVLTTGAERIVLGGGLCALGKALENGIRSELTRDASTSDFVAALELADRFELLPSDVPVAALGAALLPSVAQL
ncbi:ROK family protein [Arthrobacter sp. MYb227]|uniref:ROK family protein n=1 Tax=Arthrobacter sp. MYb227 TaxID=1848601 RepID=UPI0015E3EBDF|nr:ROK family protein [Arthrobacter sp. MYb227]